MQKTFERGDPAGTRFRQIADRPPRTGAMANEGVPGDVTRERLRHAGRAETWNERGNSEEEGGEAGL